MKLGDWAQISIGVPDLTATLPFYETIGFKKIAQDTQPYPWAQLTDGVIVVLLNQDGLRYSGLLYFAADMAGRVAELERLGIAFAQKTEQGGQLFRAIFLDPDGFGVGLVNADPSRHYRPDGKSFSKCGKFGEFSLRVKDLPASMAFWQQLGFKALGGDREPYPWQIISDGLISIGLHQSNDAEAYQKDHFKEPTITYFSTNSAERIAQLKREGIQTTFEIKSGQDVVNEAGLQAPDGQNFFVFHGAI
jgi:predicted lactoylglutathione lyase